MKILCFSEPLPKMILDGEKTISWRINDEKNISVGDEISLCYNDKKEFGKAKVIWVKETTFGDMTNEDKDGHEKFDSVEESYRTYSKYYKMDVKPQTRLKVIKFELI